MALWNLLKDTHLVLFVTIVQSSQRQDANVNWSNFYFKGSALYCLILKSFFCLEAFYSEKLFINHK